jgi:hypothetical protein
MVLQERVGLFEPSEEAYEANSKENQMWEIGRERRRPV